MKRLFLILIILLVVGTLSTVFTIDETEQVVILQFGQPVRIIKEPGLNFKLPATFDDFIMLVKSTRYQILCVVFTILVYAYDVFYKDLLMNIF